MPGYYGDRAPHINFILSHDSIKENFQTQMFFLDHPRNIYDPIYLSIGQRARNLITANVKLINPNNPSDGKYASFNIKLNILYSNKTY